MVTLIGVGLCLLFMGWYRTLVIYVAVILSAISLIIVDFLGASLSYLFWSETVRNFHGGGYMISWFVERPNFHLWEAPIAPVLFFFDLIWKAFQFCWQCPNIFSIGIFAYWWYLMFLLWIIVAKLIFPAKLTVINQQGQVIR